eukprot:Hpha_TRINITY_DN35107_c0_g1::TRINITY_DN35107_c0_g1_i1::g.168455::m.168455
MKDDPLAAMMSETAELLSEDVKDEEGGRRELAPGVFVSDGAVTGVVSDRDAGLILATQRVAAHKFAARALAMRSSPGGPRDGSHAVRLMQRLSSLLGFRAEDGTEQLRRASAKPAVRRVASAVGDSSRLDGSAKSPEPLPKRRRCSDADIRIAYGARPPPVPREELTHLRKVYPQIVASLRECAELQEGSRRDTVVLFAAERERALARVNELLAGQS